MDDEMNLEELKKFWEKNGSKVTLVVLFWAVILSIVCIILGISKWMEGYNALGNNAGNLDKMANLGSYLQGSTGSLWALAGFFVVFLAFLIQAVQLSEQRKQSKIQNESIARQNFESSFFQMLVMHHDIVQSMSGYNNKKGRDCFEDWYSSFKNSRHCGCTYGPANIYSEREIVAEAKDSVEKYLAFYKDHQGALGHYFRNLYHIFKFVNEADALNNADPSKEYKQRRRYTSLVRAALSQYELAFLFYNCASKLGNEDFKPLVKKYELLENFNDADLVKEDDWSFYEDEPPKETEHGSQNK